MISSKIQNKGCCVLRAAGEARKIIHILAPTTWVSNTVSSVKAIRRDIVDGDEVVGDLDLTKRVTSRRVRTPSVNADIPIQRMATTWEGIEIGLSCS
jgi:hypothetical protein